MSDFSVKFEPTPQVPANPGGTNVENSDSGKPKEAQGLPCEMDLMRRLASGDETAMNRLLEQHGEMLARLVGRLTAWSADHEDIFQEVLLVIWQKAGSFRGMGSLEGWLRRLAVNRCYNQLRRQNSIRRLLAKLVEFRQSVQQPAETCYEPSLEMQTALKKLPVNDRAVLVLFYLEEMKGEEVANALGIKTASLHVRLHRARKKLKSFLSPEGDA